MKRLLFAILLALAPVSGSMAQDTIAAWTPISPSVSLAVTSSTGRVAYTQKPTGASQFTIWIYNAGSNTAYVKPGTSTVTAATTDTPIAAGTSAVFLVSSLNTHIAAITASSTTTIYVSTGTGIPFSAGGGSSGGAGGAVDATIVSPLGTQTIADSVATTECNGCNVTLGLTTDAAATPGSTGTLSAKERLMTSQLDAISTAVQGPIPAGTAIIGKVGIDQTTPGTTNGVVVNSITAGETHIGEVGGNQIDITNAMTTSNNSITTGEALGGLQTLAGAVRVSGSVGAAGTSGIIQKAVISFTDAVAGTSGDVYFFNANPSGSTCTDNTAFALAAADRAKVIAIAHITDFTGSNTAVIAQGNNLAMPFSVGSATSIYACVVARSTWAVTGTSNASLLVSVLRN